MLRKVIVASLLLFLTIAASTVDAQQRSGNQYEIVFHQNQGSIVDLSGFPDNTSVTFAMRTDEDYLNRIYPSYLRLYEDGQEIVIDETATIDTSHEPMSFSIVFDYAPEQGAATHIPTVSELDDLMYAILGRKGEEDTTFARHADDSWLFCSTTSPSGCLKLQGTPGNLFRDDNGAPEFLIAQDLHQALFADNVQTVPFDVLLRRALSASDHNKELVIVKIRPQADIPYISDSLLTELLLSGVPVITINLTETNDTQEFAMDLRARLDELGGKYFESGGPLYWKDGIDVEWPHYRPTHFTLSYPSRLLRDERTHSVLLGYETPEISVWNEAEFQFFSEERLQGTTNSSLSPTVTTWNGIITVMLFLFLLFLLIWSVQNPDEDVERRRSSIG